MFKYLVHIILLSLLFSSLPLKSQESEDAQDPDLIGFGFISDGELVLGTIKMLYSYDTIGIKCKDVGSIIDVELTNLIDIYLREVGASIESLNFLETLSVSRRNKVRSCDHYLNLLVNKIALSNKHVLNRIREKHRDS